MADVKISALPAATTPVAGTEVLPIVQSSTTKKVAISDLTAGRTMTAAGLTLTTTPLGVASGGTGLTSLTAGYIPYGAGAGAFGNSANLQFDGNYLGIGGAPSVALDIFSGVPQIRVRGTGTTSEFRINSAFGAAALAAIGTVDASPMMFFTNNTERARIDSSGNLLVGTTSSPSGTKKLRVADSILDDLAVGSGAHFDTSNATPISLSESSNALLITGTGYYLVLVAERNQTGNTALFLLGNGAAVLINQTGGAWTTGTTPSATQMSIGFSGGNYRLYNGLTTVATYLFSATIIRCF